MGIESDQVVYEYLSRVGDVAHQRQLPSAVRMRLVSELRNEIDRERAKATADSPAAVRRILDRLGTPNEVVEAAGGAGRPQPPSAAVPVHRGTDSRGTRDTPDGEERPKGLRRIVPRPRPAEPERPAPRSAPSPPHLAAAHELGDSAMQPDWWRVQDSPFGPAGGDDLVPGFVGGVEIPDLLKQPRKEPEEAEGTPEEPAKAADQQPAARPRTLRRRLFARRTPPPAPPAPAARPARRLLPGPAAGWSNPLLLLAAAALVAGAVLDNLVALGAGWLIAYTSRRLTPVETKWAVLGVPGLAVASGLVWLWGRSSGRWGSPIAQGHMNDAVAGTWPWVLRGAAVASALFLLWRSQRKR
ncbi:hypothetical protein J2Z21_005565 [Streptomyces griseochromogenes]|uniref:Uncharacterized protein n=1 Tax=Streptomyces griseochromogenes TaxID=68214 RepID=A0A1B1BAG0_9ACTN|nr:hypothetical protein [Streptomyces griseochromogenes]ANP55777.1 hypothetical protein AVL59_44775 [Streptomyces griseochromogenes]MBP2052578.1 hypothetical protein [Streptomyces griseochromogenes]